jgi:acyl carrier protein
MSKLGNDQVYSNEDISWEIKSILSEVLKLPVDSIDDEKSLIELGLSSLSAVELTEKLNQISIHVLLASDLYEIKNIDQLVTLVVEGVRPKGLVNNWLLPLNDAPDHVVKLICFPDLGKLTIKRSTSV